ncbi:hypothetical protein SDC9_206506 [bioreactor metagenome]|uniref:Uncharacterized protein n=1 Tax=bioreactor metagenome TaxID=1076179 RepID=A0A645J594_9ZZZZ
MQDALGGDCKVRAAGQGLFDQLFQLAGVEAAPPLGVELDIQPGVGRGFGPGQRQIDAGTGVRQWQGAATEGECRAQYGEATRAKCGVKSHVHSEARATTGSRRAALRAGR